MSQTFLFFEQQARDAEQAALDAKRAAKEAAAKARAEAKEKEEREKSIRRLMREAVKRLSLLVCHRSPFVRTSRNLDRGETTL